MRIIYISPSETITLCRGLTDGQTRGKLCHMKACTATPKRSRALLPWHAHLMLSGSHIVHALPLFCYKEFSDGTIQKLQQTLVRLEERANTGSLCNTTPQDQMEDEVKNLLILDPDNSNPTTNSKALPLKPHSSPRPIPTASPYLEAAKKGIDPPPPHRTTPSNTLWIWKRPTTKVLNTP